MIGERLGKWIIYKELGRGGMGRVYLAQEEIGGRQAAIKILAGELVQEGGFLQRFQREIETLATLDHPGIVRFYESGYENGYYFYAMEYVEGQSLEAVLEEYGTLPWRQTLAIARQLCPSLKHVHDHGIVHRDLKPGNILCTPSGQVKLTDFGIAKVFAGQHMTATGGVVGTPEFISPEQAAGKPATKKSDLYSLGVVLYMLLTGRLPFSGKSVPELLHKHCYGRFDMPKSFEPDIPDEFQDIICSLLAKDPARRPADCLVLAKQLDSLHRHQERQAFQTQTGGTPEPTLVENKTDIPLEGPATLTSRLVREELNRQNAGHPLFRLVNRFWVLAPLLVLCLATLVWAFWPMNEEALFTHAQELMQSEQLHDMEIAWRDYLDPLERRFPNHPYKEEVTKYKAKLDAARNPTPSEARRFYFLGERLAQDGKPAEAQRFWLGVVEAFNGIDAEKDWVERARKGLNDLQLSQKGKDRLLLVKPVLDQAAALRDAGHRDEAERKWTALEALYRDDPAGIDVLAEVAQARKK